MNTWVLYSSHGLVKVVLFWGGAHGHAKGMGCSFGLLAM